MSKKSGYTPNDQRSIAKNPTSAAYAHDVANRQALGHALPPETPAPPAESETPPAESETPAPKT